MPSRHQYALSGQKNQVKSGTETRQLIFFQYFTPLLYLCYILFVDGWFLLAILYRRRGVQQRPEYTTVDDDIICTEKIIADRKTFFIDLKSNARGRVVRITEKVSSNRDRIMVPAEILDDFIEALQDIRRANLEN